MRVTTSMLRLLSGLGMLRNQRWREGDDKYTRRLFCTWPTPENGGDRQLDVLVEWSGGEEWMLYLGEGATEEQWERIPVERRGLMWPVGVRMPWGELHDREMAQRDGIMEARGYGAARGWAPVVPWIEQEIRGREVEWGTYEAPGGIFAAVMLNTETGAWWVTCRTEADFDRLDIPEKRRARRGQTPGIVKAMRKPKGRTPKRVSIKAPPTPKIMEYGRVEFLAEAQRREEGVRTAEEARAAAEQWAEGLGYTPYDKAWKTDRRRWSRRYVTPIAIVRACVWPDLGIWAVAGVSKGRAASLGVPKYHFHWVY